MAKVGIIGGSGLYSIDGVAQLQELQMWDTPFGQPSDSFFTGELDGIEVVFLSRHGRGHRISPSEINYRANIFGMKKLGVDAVISVSACGSLREELKPMDFVVPHQIVDWTKGRKSTFFEGGIVAHASFADPISREVADIVAQAGRESGATVHEGGTYITMEGPQFSTKAESNLYRQWGMDIIGMTNATEAKLAREAEISYATLAAVTDYDCWHPAHDSVTVEMIIQNLTANVANAKKILKTAIPLIGKLENFSAQDAMKYAIITAQDKLTNQHLRELEPIIGKYIK
ncbi:MAG: S-methyl-5'-thioadenosine phosphorylase [Candidatus Omnitrophica bacterium]|nr:S-methyl-5'-thioadenosine phosphorylase [Candidatus Omnitrophota bacterium]